MNINTTWAIAYAEKHGFSVFPVHSINGFGRCSCGNNQCQNDGKHPVIKGGFKNATKNIQQIQKWWELHNANIGIATGEPSGCCVIDVDPRNGGLNSFEIMKPYLGDLSKVPTVKTGGGGFHYYFKNNKNIKSMSGVLPGIDIKSDGGYVVAPPSNHKSGNTYEPHFNWEINGQIHFPEFPIALLNFLLSKKQVSRPHEHNTHQNHSGKIAIGSRNEFLASVAGSLRNKGFEIEEIKGTLFQINNTLLEEKLTSSEVDSIANSISRYPKGRKTLNNNPPKLNDTQRNIIFRGKLSSLYKKITAESEAHELALHLQLLTFLGCAVGKLPTLIVGTTKHHCNLFSVIVGDTSRARKGTSLNYIESIFEQIDPNFLKYKIVRGISSGEGLISCVRDEEKKKELKTNKEGKTFEHEVLIHEGVKDKRLLIIDEEFASTLSVLQREGNNLSQIIRSSWDGKTLEIKTKNSPIRGTNPHVSIIGHVTKNELTQSLKSVERTNGFANRFIWAWVSRDRLVPLAKPFDMHSIKEEIQWLKDALSYGGAVSNFKLSSDGQIQFSEIYKFFNDKEYSSDIEPLTARAEPIILRMALIYALLDRTTEINKEHIEAANEVWKYSEQSVEYIFSNQKYKSSNEEKILNFIKARGGEVSRSDISRILFNKNKPVSEIDEILTPLLERKILGTKSINDNAHSEIRIFLVEGYGNEQ